MARRLAAAGLALVGAACGAGAAHLEAPREAARACPPVDDVRFAFWFDVEPLDEPLEGRPSVGYWSIPVGYVVIDESARAPVPGPIDAETLLRLGFDSVPGTLHLTRAGQPSCRASNSGYLGELIEEGASNVRVSAVTTDCAVEGSTRAVAWVTPSALLGCDIAPVELLGEHRLELRGDETFPPDEPLPVPAPYGGALAPSACTGPCRTLWSVWVARGAPDLAEVWVTHLTPGDPSQPCDWEYQDEPGLYASSDGRGRLVPWPMLRDGDEHSMTLAGLMVDATGSRVALFTEVATWGAYEVEASGMLGHGRTVTYYASNEEDGTFRSLAPYCGP